MRLNRLFLPALVALFLALPAAAHHGWSSYEAEALRFDAELIEVRYRNPHAEVEVEHDGNRWRVVLAPTTRMETRGLPDGGLVAGKTITIEAYPRLDGTRELRAERIVVDGTTIELR
jgi:hypothetical protein